MDNYKIISTEPAFWSRVGWAADPTRFTEDGEIMFYSDDWSSYLNEHKLFYEQGIKLHTIIIHNGWTGVNQYNFSALDKTLNALCSIAPDIMIMPRIKMNPPVEWCLENPTEVYLNQAAPREPSAIKALINKLTPYYTTNGLTDDVPDDEGIAGLQSFTSQKWLNDSAVALAKLVEHINSTKYAENIVGYQLGIGMCGENAYWGGWSRKDRWGDFGHNAAESFKDFCIRKYGSLENVLTEYGLSDIASPQELIPTPTMRSHTPENLADFFRKDNARAIDYSIFMTEATTNAICTLAKAMKKATGNMPIGTFYGYIYTSTPSETGHLGIQTLLDCKDIDFIASPKGYYRCNPGGPGGTQATAMSAGRAKIWFDELDNCTHIGKTMHNPVNRPKTLMETRSVYWREAAKNLAWGNLNFWWMDLMGDWFNDKDIMHEIGRIYKFNSRMRTLPQKNISQILLIHDEKSFHYHNADKKLTGGHFIGVLNQITTELLMCGAPVDEYRLADLPHINLSQYKMIVFANTYFIDRKARNLIKNIPADKLCIFNYAAGIRNPEYSLDNVADLTNMEIEEFHADFKVSDGYGCEVELPPIRIKEQPDLQIIDSYPDGGIKTAKYGNKILCAAPCYTAVDFHKLAKDSGCHMYAPPGCTVYADSRFTGLFPSKNESAPIHMPENGNYRELVHGNTYSGKDPDIPLIAKDAIVLEKL